MNMEQRGFRRGMIVRSYKGKLYRIDQRVENTRFGEPVLIYSDLQAPHGTNVLPERKVCAEINHMKYPDVKQKYRFEIASEFGSNGEKND